MKLFMNVKKSGSEITPRCCVDNYNVETIDKHTLNYLLTKNFNATGY